MLYEALRACASDGELSAGERERVRVAADQVGVSREIVDKLEAIIHEEGLLRKRRHQLLVAEPLAALQG
jgi:hypothetical protein